MSTTLDDETIKEYCFALGCIPFHERIVEIFLHKTGIVRDTALKRLNYLIGKGLLENIPGKPARVKYLRLATNAASQLWGQKIIGFPIEQIQLYEQVQITDFWIRSAELQIRYPWVGVETPQNPRELVYTEREFPKDIPSEILAPEDRDWLDRELKARMIISSRKDPEISLRVLIWNVPSDSWNFIPECCDPSTGTFSRKRTWQFLQELFPLPTGKNLRIRASESTLEDKDLQILQQYAEFQVWGTAHRTRKLIRTPEMAYRQIAEKADIGRDAVADRSRWLERLGLITLTGTKTSLRKAVTDQGRALLNLLDMFPKKTRKQRRRIQQE